MKLSLIAISSLVFFAAMSNAVAHADEPAPKSPEHVMVSFTVGALTVARATPAVATRVSYCSVDARGNLACGAPVTMGHVNRVEHK